MFGSRKASLLETWLLLLAFSGALLLLDPGRQWVAALYIIIIISNFRETFAKKNVTFANSEKKLSRGFPT